MKHIFKPVYAALALLTVYLLICSSAVLEWDTHGNVLAHNYGVWGDWSAHFTFISNFLERGLHWIVGDNPLYSGMPSQYPFLSHLFTAGVALVLNTDVITATYGVSLALCVFLPFCLFQFYREVGLKAWTALAAVILLLFIGGFEFWDGSLNPAEPITNQGTSGAAFTQIFVFEFLPQRAFLFGLVFFTSLGTWMLRRLKAKTFHFPQALLACFLLALSSWLHLHTWIAGGCILLMAALFPPLSSQKAGLALNERKKILFFGLGTILFSAFFIGFLLFRKKGPDAYTGWSIWFPGWAQNPAAPSGKPQEMNPIWFWLYNTGFFLPLSLLGAFSVWKERKENSLLFPMMISGFFLFTFSLLINIQPYYYDNLKIMTYAFAFLAPVAALSLEKIATSFKEPVKKWAMIFCVALLGVQSLSAIHDLEFVRNHKHTAGFLSRSEFFLAENFKALRTSADALVLITPRHNHWVPCLTGNPVVMGYAGWLWSWGISSGERQKKVEEILAGGPLALQWIEELKPEYVIVQASEKARDQIPVNIEFFKQHYPLLLEKQGWFIFSTQITKSPSSSVR